MFKKISAILMLLFLCVACTVQAAAEDYFVAHNPDFDWTRNQSRFHTKQYTYLYGENINIIKDGFLYLPMFTELKFTIRNQDDNELKDGETIKTGDRLTEWRDGDFAVLSTFVYWGDVEADGKIDAADARKALRASTGLIALSDAEKEAADLDNDGIVTPADARTILRKSLHLQTEEVKEGYYWDDYFYRTTLLVLIPKEDFDTEIAMLRSTYKEVIDVRIIAVDYVSADTQEVYALLYVDSFEEKNRLAERISTYENKITVSCYALA